MSNEASTTEKTLRWIGDLDHPFYNDERNRFVWYEASAIAFQMFFFVNVAMAGFMFWIGGSTGLPYGIAVLVVTYLVAGVVIRYAKNRYAEYVPETSDFFARRNVFNVAIQAFMIIGLIRAVNEAAPSGEGEGFAGGIVPGLIGGLGGGLLVAIAVIVWKRRKEDAAAAADEF